MIRVEVVFARPDDQVILPVALPEGATLREAIVASGVLERFPEIDLARHRVGVFARLRAPDALVRDGDRIEIYRLLVADPKDGRRRRAQALR